MRLNEENDDCCGTIRVPESTGTSTSIFSQIPNKFNELFHMCAKNCSTVSVWFSRNFTQLNLMHLLFFSDIRIVFRISVT